MSVVDGLCDRCDRPPVASCTTAAEHRQRARTRVRIGTSATDITAIYAIFVAAHVFARVFARLDFDAFAILSSGICVICVICVIFVIFVFAHVFAHTRLEFEIAALVQRRRVRETNVAVAETLSDALVPADGHRQCRK